MNNCHIRKFYSVIAKKQLKNETSVLWLTAKEIQHSVTLARNNELVLLNIRRKNYFTIKIVLSVGDDAFWQ